MLDGSEWGLKGTNTGFDLDLLTPLAPLHRNRQTRRHSSTDFVRKPRLVPNYIDRFGPVVAVQNTINGTVDCLGGSAHGFVPVLGDLYKISRHWLWLQPSYTNELVRPTVVVTALKLGQAALFLHKQGYLITGLIADEDLASE